MPFFTYEIELRPRGVKAFRKPKEISLAGANGPIATFVRNQTTKTTRSPFEWDMRESDLITALGYPPPEVKGHSIIIDLKPRDKTHAHLYHLQEIWGFSYDDWTPILLRLEELAVKSKASIQNIKKEFSVSKKLSDPVFEFLYLRGGLRSDAWPWGPVGSVNGVLLWPDALHYFISEIVKKGIGKV